MEGLILFFALALFIYAVRFFHKKNKQIEEEVRNQKQKKQMEIQENNLKTIRENYKNLIENDDTETEFDGNETSYGEENIIHGGALNYSNWSFENTLRFIGKNSLKLKHIDTEKYAFKHISFDLDSKKSFSKNLDVIASQTEKVKKYEVQNKTDITEAIKHINLVKNEIKKLKSWIIQNIEKILIENAKKGRKLPFVIYFKDHYDKSVQCWLNIEFERLGLSHPDVYNLDEQQTCEKIFTLISSNLKIDRHFKKLNLEYCIYKNLDGLIIFKEGEKSRYLKGEIYFN